MSNTYSQQKQTGGWKETLQHVYVVERNLMIIHVLGLEAQEEKNWGLEW